MNTTIDIPDKVLERAMLASGTKTAHESVLKAMDEFVSQHDQHKLIPLLGTLDDFMTPKGL